MRKNLNSKKKLKTIDVVYIGIFAAIIAVCSWVSIPFGTVPVTLQTMAVCLVAGLLGAKRGTFTVAVYILLGIIGVPVFAGFSSGVGYALGATGGYLIGFIFTALTVGIVTKLLGKKWWSYFVSMIIGILICYVFGTAWFMIVYNKNNANAVSLTAVLSMCVTPFIISDLAKAALAAALCVKLNKYIK